MMLFKFDIKYAKLNFKAMASMDFSFSLKLNLLCSYDGSLFMKTVENCFKKFWKIRVSRVSIDWKLLPIDQVKQDLLFDLIDFWLLVDWSNALFRSIE